MGVEILKLNLKSLPYLFYCYLQNQLTSYKESKLSNRYLGFCIDPIGFSVVHTSVVMLQ